MPPAIESILRALGLERLLDNTPWELLSRLERPEIFAQIAIIVLSGVAAYWIAHRIRQLLDAIIPRVVPALWVSVLSRALGSVAAPLTWLFVLWVANIIAGVAGFTFGLTHAAVSLLVAWIFIRLFSYAVRSPLWANLIAIVAWTLAALSILNLLGPLVHQLDASALQFGKIRISALTVVRAVFILCVLLWATTLFSNFLERRITRAQTLTPSLQALLIQVMRLMLPALAVVAALYAVGVDLTAFTVFSGAVGIGVGLGLQRTVANLVAGLALIVGKSIKPGDVIAYKDTYGWVTNMGARFVTLCTRDGKEYLVPNDEFLQQGVENWSYSAGRLRLKVPVGVAYDADIRHAMSLCVDAAKAVSRVLSDPEPTCLLKGYGDSSVDLEIRVWINDPRNGVSTVKSEILLGVWDRFAQSGIGIPFPQRDLHLVDVPKDGVATVTGNLASPAARRHKPSATPDTG